MNASELVGTTVVFDETGEERRVLRECKVCGDLDRGSEVVSPSGIAHIGEVEGDTKCGKDATGDAWWWPM